MKAIGHVSSALIATIPLIYYKEQFPEALMADSLNAYELLWWCGLFAVLPDTDIILRKFLPIKHRGYFSHSIVTVIFTGLLIFGAYMLGQNGTIPALKYCTPFTAILASYSVFMHLVGDSITKTGVPFFKPNSPCHFPFIGGYAAFDNYFLNAIPVVAATYLIGNVFGYNPDMMKYFGKFKDYVKVMTTEKPESETTN